MIAERMARARAEAAAIREQARMMGLRGPAMMPIPRSMVDLERDSIVRRDFKRSLRGYDEWEVQAHLKQVHQALSALLHTLAAGDGDIPPAVADRIRSQATLATIEAQEVRAAAETQAQAEKDAVNQLVLKTLEEAAEEVDRLIAKGRAEAAVMVEEAERENAVRRRAMAEEIDAVRERVLGEARAAAEQMLAQGRAGHTPGA